MSVIRKLALIPGFLILSAALIAVSPIMQTASAGTWTGRAAYHGYFDNRPAGACAWRGDPEYGNAPTDLGIYPADKLSSACGAPVMPHNSGWSYGGQGSLSLNAAAILASPSNQDRARAFVRELRTEYNNGSGNHGGGSPQENDALNRWTTTGVAYIVNTMLGRGPGSSRTITPADFNELEARLIGRADAGRINFEKTINVQSAPYNGLNTFYQAGYPIGANDVAYYNGSGQYLGIEIQDDAGNIVYGMWYYCANPLGDLGGVPAANAWNINGQSYIKNSLDPNKAGSQQGTIGDVKPGDRLNWYHDMRNIGPNDMNRSVYFTVDKTGFSNGWDATKDPLGNASGANGVLFVYEYASDNRAYTKYDVTQADVGKTLCQRISWTPGSSSSAAQAASNYACANVPFNFTLTPTVGTDKTTAESNTKVNVTGTVVNNGPTRSPDNSKWEMVQVVVNPGDGIPQIGSPGRASNGAQPACTFYGTGCTSVGSGSEPGGFNPGIKTLPPANVLLGDFPAGTQVCYGVAAQPRSNESSDWIHSELTCTVISKKPSINILGNDTIVGKGAATPSNISTSTSTKQLPTETESRIFGSWTEYGVIANGNVKGMASAAGYAGGQVAVGGAAVDTIFCGVSFLTVTNAGTSGQCKDDGLTPKGRYVVSTGFPAMSEAFSTTGPAITSDKLDDVVSGTYSVPSGNYSIQASGVGLGKSIIINAPNANVTINGNITYTEESLSKVQDIPQLVIIANNITIAAGVERVDAWLIATGTSGELNTCGDVTWATVASLNSTVCASQLVVNGPVVARKLYLFRTYGADTGLQTGTPAETFNLRADAYLWASNYKSTNPRLQTASTVELPPRY